MKKTTILMTLAAIGACFGVASCSNAGGSMKGAEPVHTVDKATFEKYITNTEFFNLTYDVTFDIAVEGGQSGTLKLSLGYMELRTANPSSYVFYVVGSDEAHLYIADPSTMTLMSRATVSYEAAVGELKSAIGFLGSDYVYEQFAYQADKGVYHADVVHLASGFDMTDVDYCFEDGLLVRASGKQQFSDSDNPIPVSVSVYDYNNTNLKFPDFKS